MKKFEFDFTNEWTLGYGFDFIRVGYFNSFGSFSLEATILGLSFSFTFNSDEAIAEDKEIDDFLNNLAVANYEATKNIKTKNTKNTKNTKKTVKTVKKTKKSK